MLLLLASLVLERGHQQFKLYHLRGLAFPGMADSTAHHSTLLLTEG